MKDLRKILANTKTIQGDMFGAKESQVDENLIIYEDLVGLIESGNAIYIHLNVPSLKNSKQIFQMNTGKSACCVAPYEKQPDILKEDGTKIRQYLCTSCNMTLPILGKRATLQPSDTHKRYKTNSMSDYISNRGQWLKIVSDKKSPLHLGLYFIRDSKRIFDYDNAYSTVADLLRDNGWISDDDMESVKPVFLGYHVDKETAGVIITLLKTPTYEYYSDNINDNTPHNYNYDNSIESI